MMAILNFQSEMFLAIFDLQVALILHTKLQVNWPLKLRRRGQKKIFKMVAILDFWLEKL